MTQEDLILGENVVLEIEKGGEYLPYACAIDVSIDTKVETKEIRTATDGKWKKTRPRKWDYTVSMSGLVLVNDSGPFAFDLQEAVIGGLYINFRLKFDEPNSTLVKIFNGTTLATNSTLAGGASGFASGAFDFEGYGAYELLDGIVGCDATLASLSVGESNQDGHPDNTLRVNFTGVANAVQLDYSIDGGGRDTIYVSEGVSGTFYVFGLSAGAHTITVWPVCPDGDDGEPIVRNFNL